MIFMFLAGTSQVVYYYLFKFNFRRVIQNEELWFYTATVILFGVLLSIILLLNTTMHPEMAFREGFFNVISLLTTTGFATADYILWPSSALLIIFPSSLYRCMHRIDNRRHKDGKAPYCHKEY